MKKDVKLSGRELMQLYRSEHETMKNLEAQRNETIALIADVEAARSALKSIKSNPKESAIVVPLGSGVFSEAKITDPDNVKINLPGGVVITHSAEEALDRLGKRKDQLRKDAENLDKERQRIAVNLKEIGSIIQQGREFAISELEKKVGDKKTESAN